MTVRYFGNHTFTFVSPGLWISPERFVLREEFRGVRHYHDWVAERWGEKDWVATEHYGIGWTQKEAAECLP